MDTFELLPSLASGEVSETSAPELVAAVFRARASGTLFFELDDGKEIRIFFRAGDMCGTGSFQGFRSLAHVLLANDWVGALDIEKTQAEALATKKRHGEVLTAKGMLTPEQLRLALATQHRQNLATLMELTRGRYDWRGWEPPPTWAREVTVDPVACLVDALEVPLLEPRRRRVLDWLGRSPARLSVDWPELQGRIAFAGTDRRASALLALPRRLDEFVSASRLPQARAEALLVALLLVGGAEAHPVSAGSDPAPQHEPLPEPHLEQSPEPEAVYENPHVEAQFAGEPPEGPVTSHASYAADEPTPAELDSFELLPEPGELDLAATEIAHASLDLEAEVLPDPEGFPEPELPAPDARVGEEEAFARLESLEPEDLHVATGENVALGGDDEPLELDTAPRTEQRASALSAEPPARDDSRGRDMRMKMLQRGMRNLGNLPQPELEAEPEMELEVAAPPPKRLEQPANLSADEQRFVDDVRSRARLAPTQTAYARLGVAPNAGPDALKGAFIQAAKRFHPDRAAGGLGFLQPELQSLFSALKEAYDQVATPEARGKYDQALKSGAGTAKGASRKEEAVLSLKMGDVLLKKRDFDGALVKLRRAVELDPSADALAALAWGLICDPKHAPATKEEAASLISRALRAPGLTARAYYVAGVIWRTKDPESAADAFRKALELEPNHPDASLELRLLEMRQGKGKQPGGGVLSGLLFGKRKPS